MNYIRKGLGINRSSLLEAAFNRKAFQRNPFSLKLDDLLKMYELRLWYIQNSHSAYAEEKVKAMQIESERLNGEINYHRARGILLRALAVFGSLIVYFKGFYTMPEMNDWDDVDKGMFKIYGGLEEGAPEGQQSD